MIGPKDGLLYVSTELDNSITVIDPATLKILHALPTGQSESHMRAETMGNVRDHAYDFRAVCHGPEADRFRASVRAHECACPLANASYTNLLLDGPSLARVTAHMAGV